MKNSTGYVYKYTHKTNGRWYIGSHNGKKENYAGSGVAWRKATKKYGVGAFTKEILYSGLDYRKEEQRILIKLDAANDPMSYNLKNQALGGTFKGAANGMFGKKHTAEAKEKIGNAFRGKPKEFKHSRIGVFNSNYKHGLQTKERYAELASLRKALGKYHLRVRRECPYCGLIGEGPNMTRYHFDNCKKKEYE